MDLKDIIISSRQYLQRFDYDNYPECFAEFESKVQPVFSDFSRKDLNAEADVLIAALEEENAGLPRRAAKDAQWQDKQVLAFFLTPAAVRGGAITAEFAGILYSKWNSRYPRNTYAPTTYEAIVKGFDSNVLGIILRKSKK